MAWILMVRGGLSRGLASRWRARRGYDRTQLFDAAALRDFTVEIIRRSDDVSGFKVLPGRWVVERTFGWMTRWRRLVRDYKKRLDVSEAMIHLAMASILLRRLAT